MKNFTVIFSPIALHDAEQILSTLVFDAATPLLGVFTNNRSVAKLHSIVTVQASPDKSTG